ncbi:MAG: site-specific DNA-methyltransferase [Bacilli bacterium]|nr:site-specific DNA-methyltransferase [Bacilli bacterium]
MNKIELSDVFDYLDKLEDESIDLAIIDPPYNLNQGEWDQFSSFEKFLDFTERYLEIVFKKLKSNGSLYIFNTARNSAYILLMLEKIGMKYRNWIIWYKRDGFSSCKRKYVNNQETILFFTKTNKYTFNYDEIRESYSSSERIEAARKKGILKNGKRWFPNSKGKLCADVWNYTSVRLTNKENGKTVKQKHPTPKPEALIERMILASSNENDVVLDLFSGTGTTAYVAQKNNRNFTGCESNPEYIKIIEERLKYDIDK